MKIKHKLLDYITIETCNGKIIFFQCDFATWLPEVGWKYKSINPEYIEACHKIFNAIQNNEDLSI